MIAIDFLSQIFATSNDMHLRAAGKRAPRGAHRMFIDDLSAPEFDPREDGRQKIAAPRQKAAIENPVRGLQERSRGLRAYLEGTTRNIIALIMRKTDVFDCFRRGQLMEATSWGPQNGLHGRKAQGRRGPGLSISVACSEIRTGMFPEPRTQRKLVGKTTTSCRYGELLSLIPAQNRDELVKFWRQV